MTREELRDRIKVLVKTVYKDKVAIEKAAVEYDELTKFPELKDVIVSLLGPQFDAFVASIDWVAPKPTTFRIVLANDETFLLIWAVRSWICTVEGKRYYLLNLSEEERATEAIARILAYGNGQAEAPADGELTAAESSSTKAGAGDFPGGDGGEDVGGEEEVEITDTETTTEEPAEEA